MKTILVTGAAGFIGKALSARLQEAGYEVVGFDIGQGDITHEKALHPYVYVENDRPTALPNRLTAREGMGFWRKGPTASDFDHEQTLPNLVGRAEKYIVEKSKEKDPFFLYLALTAPHTPILPSPEFRGKSGLNDYGDFVLMVDAMKLSMANGNPGLLSGISIVFLSGIIGFMFSSSTRGAYGAHFGSKHSMCAT